MYLRQLDPMRSHPVGLGTRHGVESVLAGTEPSLSLNPPMIMAVVVWLGLLWGER